jgi:hypothetical protein
VIQAFSYPTRREWRVHGPLGVAGSASGADPSLVAASSSIAASSHGPVGSVRPPRRARLNVDLEVDVDGAPFFRRTWDETVERSLV